MGMILHTVMFAGIGLLALIVAAFIPPLGRLVSGALALYSGVYFLMALVGGILSSAAGAGFWSPTVVGAAENTGLGFVGMVLLQQPMLVLGVLLAIVQRLRGRRLYNGQTDGAGSDDGRGEPAPIVEGAAMEPREQFPNLANQYRR